MGIPSQKQQAQQDHNKPRRDSQRQSKGLVLLGAGKGHQVLFQQVVQLVMERLRKKRWPTRKIAHCYYFITNIHEKQTLKKKVLFVCGISTSHGFLDFVLKGNQNNTEAQCLAGAPYVLDRPRSTTPTADPPCFPVYPRHWIQRKPIPASTNISKDKPVSNLCTSSWQCCWCFFWSSFFWTKNSSETNNDIVWYSMLSHVKISWNLWGWAGPILVDPLLSQGQSCSWRGASWPVDRTERSLNSEQTQSQATTSSCESIFL